MNRARATVTRPSAPPCRARGRSAFACTLAIMIAGVLLVFVVLLGRYAATELNRLRTEALGAQADQILLSARAWSDAHGDRLRGTGTIELPLGDLLAAPAVGRLELRHAEEGADPPLIECSLKITQGRRAVFRHVFWPAPGSH